MSRVRTNFITNRFADGAPTVSNGLIISGVTTTSGLLDANGDLDVDGHTNLDNVSIAGVVTATTFVGDGDFVDLDVDGHAEFDNISVSGVTTSIGTFHIRPSNGQLTPKISYNDSIAEALIFGDNVQARFGTSSDLRIYHDSNHSYIDDTGTGNLKLRSNNFRVSNADESKISATFQAAAGVELFYDNTSRMSTASYGIAVNGDILLQDALVHIGDTNTRIRFPSNDTISFETTGGERLRITSTGAVGIPTAMTVSTAGAIGIGHSGQVLSSRGTYGPSVWTGGTQRVLEVVASPCDGSVISTSHGNVQFQNVSGPQDLTTSYVTVAGSTISYWPPEGTKQVIYEMSMQVVNHDDATSIGHFKFYIDNNEVVYHRRNASGEDIDDFVNFKYIINIGVTENYNHGRLASWTTYKTLKMEAREYHATSNAVSLHETDHWDGAGTNMFSQPVLTITAIGC